MNRVFYSLILFFLLSFSSTVNAQNKLTSHYFIQAGYTHLKGNWREIGGKILFLKNDDILFTLGASTLIGFKNKNMSFIPKIEGNVLLNFEKNPYLYHSYYFLIGNQISAKYITPQIGISLFGLLDLTSGYAFPITHEKMKGFNVNLKLNIPLVILFDK